MFEDEKNEVISKKPAFNLSDLKKAYAQQSSAHMEIELCYSRNHVFIKPLKVRDKKDILKSIETKNDNLLNRTLTEIIEKYVENKDGSGLNTGILTQKEKEQILVYIRLASGEDKVKTVNIAHQCPECEKVTKDIKFDTDNISVTNYDTTKNGVVELSTSGISITLGPITINEEQEIESLIKKKAIKTVSERQIVMVAAIIKSIKVATNDVDALSLEEKLGFVEGLQMSDLRLLTDYLKDYDFGIKLPFDFECEHCGFKGREEVNPAVFFMS